MISIVVTSTSGFKPYHLSLHILQLLIRRGKPHCDQFSESFVKSFCAQHVVSPVMLLLTCDVIHHLPSISLQIVLIYVELIDVKDLLTTTIVIAVCSIAPIEFLFESERI